MARIKVETMMPKKLAMTLVLVTVCSILFAAPPLRIRLDNNSDWQLSVGVTELAGGAGTDIAPQESDPAQQHVWVRNSTGNWRVDVSRGGEPTWDNGIVVYVRRTSNGDAGTVSGGTTYQEITTIDTTFFTGTGDPRYIAIQFMTDGGFAGAGVGAGVYTTTITYTITDNL